MVKKKILFIEDEAELVALMEMRLQAIGYEMLSAGDGEEGLNKAQQEKPSLILLDVIMPKMDGLTLCRRLKTDPQTKDIPVIIVSASGGKDLPERCRAAGADDIIMKPYDSQDLISKIKRLIK